MHTFAAEGVTLRLPTGGDSSSLIGWGLIVLAAVVLVRGNKASNEVKAVIVGVAILIGLVSAVGQQIVSTGLQTIGWTQPGDLDKATIALLVGDALLVWELYRPKWKGKGRRNDYDDDRDRGRSKGKARR